MAGDVVGPWLKKDGVNVVSFQAAWTGDPAGAWAVDVSNDGEVADEPSGKLGATALTLPASISAGDPAGAAGNFYFDVEVAAAWIRLRYVRASGTGSISVGVNGQVT